MEKNLLDKIEKIITLQDRAGTVEEANAAASALQRILTQHNLELAEVQRRLGNKAPSTKVVSVRFNCPQAMWMRSLWHVVTQQNQGDSFYSGSTITIIAHEGKHEAIQQTVEAMAAIANVLAPKMYREYVDGQPSWRVNPSRSWTNSFKWGFVAGVKKAMIEAKEDVIQQYTGGSALVLVDQEKEVAEFMKRFTLGKPTTSTFSGSGYGAGKSAGYANANTRSRLSG